MSLPAGTRVRKVDHRGPSNLTGTVADWSFSDPNQQELFA